MKKTLTVPLYGSKINVEILETQEDVQNYIIKHNVLTPTDNGGFYGLVFFDDETQRVHLSFTREGLTPEVIAHEAIHVKNELFKLHGLYWDPTNDEPEAYLVGWLVKELSKLK